MENKRVFYACQGLSYQGVPLRGIQNVSVRTDNNTNPVENWGSLGISGVYADTPKTTISFSRILSTGTVPIATGTLEYISKKHDNKLCLFIVGDTSQAVHPTSPTGVGPFHNVFFNNLSIDSISYAISVDGFLTEDVTMIGYSKQKDDSECDMATMDFGLIQEEPIRRQHMSSISRGTKALSHENVQSLTVNIPFGVQTVEEFGTSLSQDSKKYRYPTLPIASTYSITAIYQNASGFDEYMFKGLDHSCTHTSGLPKKETLSFSTCNGGISVNFSNCILNSIDYGGGDVDGGNAEFTYSYTCYNEGSINYGGQ